MKNILQGANREVLEQFACSNVLVAFDFDGTLSPIVADRERAVVRPKTRTLLNTVSKRYPLVVISGRSRADVVRRLRDTGVQHVVGNHGIEPWKATTRVLNEVRRWQPILHKHLDGMPGVQVEDKHCSVAIHYRHSREKRRARAAIRAVVAGLGEVRVIGGKQVVNILPSGAPHKGLALERERERLRCNTAIYVGDDETDEDVFGLEQAGRLLAIRVGAKQSSQAAYFIRRQSDIDALLRFLARSRLAGSQRGGASS